VGRDAQPAQAVRRVLRERPQPDRVQGDAEDRQRQRLFPDDRQRQHQGADRFADWLQDFPNPSDFYLLLDANSIQPTNNKNFGNIDDPHIQSELAKLNPVPATKLQSVAGQWESLDEYSAKKAYELVYGSEELPQFFSDRLDFASAVFHPLYLNDWSSWQLKK
jgi:hypothetical protein